MSDLDLPKSNDEASGEEENGELGEGELDYGEGGLFEVESAKSVEEFGGEGKFKEWGPVGEYGEAAAYYLYAPEEAVEYPSVWEEGGSVASEISAVISEVEETEEEKELRREREMLIETAKQKIMERMLLRRRNIFLHKKLVEHFKKRRMENVLKEEPKGLDLESKYLRRLYAFQEFKQLQENEIEDLTKMMDQYEISTKELKEDVEEKLTNFLSKAKEVSLNLVFSKTGKKINEKTVDRLLRRLLNKNKEKGKTKLRYIKVKNLIDEKEKQLKAMEYFGDGLHIVDYEQMKIDNQNYADKIEEKEDELTKMRHKTQNIIQNLTHVREKTYAIEGDIELMEETVYDVDKKFTETRGRLTNARIKRDALREEFIRLKMASGLLTRDDLLKDFEASIAEGKNLARNLEKIKKVLNNKKNQEYELSKLVVNTNYECSLPMEIKFFSKSQCREFRNENQSLKLITL